MRAVIPIRGHSTKVAAWELDAMVSSTHFQVGDERPKFRYKVSTTSNAIRIWLEDCDSKEQWQTKILTLSEFTTGDNLVAKASITDYAKQFLACMGAPDACKSLSAVDEEGEGARVLVLRLALDVSMYSTTLVYTFHLETIQVDRVEVLAASVRDTKDAINSLQGDITSVQDRIEDEDDEIAQVKTALRATKHQVEDMTAKISRMERAMTTMQLSIDSLRDLRRGPTGHQPRSRSLSHRRPGPPGPGLGPGLEPGASPGFMRGRRSPPRSPSRYLPFPPPFGAPGYP